MCDKKTNKVPIAIALPVLIIGSFNNNKVANMMTVSFASICESKPLCICISISEKSLSYQNIKATQVFSVNVPSKGFENTCDYLGGVSGFNEDKCKESGLNYKSGSHLEVPVLEDVLVSYECQVIHSYKIDKHVMIIGQVKEIHDKSLGNNVLNELQPLSYDFNCLSYRL